MSSVEDDRARTGRDSPVLWVNKSKLNKIIDKIIKTILIMIIVIMIVTMILKMIMIMIMMTRK